MEGTRTGAGKTRRKSRRYSNSSLRESQERKVAVLPQDELAAFRSVPMLSVSSGAGGVCSARDFHNVKYALAAAKAIPQRGLALNVDPNRLHHAVGSASGEGVVARCSGGGSRTDRRGKTAGGKPRGDEEEGKQAVKSFGGMSVRVVAS